MLVWSSKYGLMRARVGKVPGAAEVFSVSSSKNTMTGKLIWNKKKKKVDLSVRISFSVPIALL